MSDRAGLTVGYVSKLERAKKANPTTDNLARLARALRVSMAFLVGETDHPMVCAARHGGGMPHIFYDHLRQRALELEPAINSMSVEQRFAFATRFVCEHLPEQFTVGALAFHFGLSLQVIESIVDHRQEITFDTLDRFCQLTHIHIDFFSRGALSPTPAPRSEAELTALAMYSEALLTAKHAGIRPAVLTQFIKLIQMMTDDGRPIT